MINESMRVSYTADGDTLRALRSVVDGGVHRVDEVRIRLAYIDTPELGRLDSVAYAVAARAYLRRLLSLGELVTVRIYGHDTYGRLLAEVLRSKDDGNCGLRLVLGGYAALWQCPADREDYQFAQQIAQRKKVGIWRSAGPWQTPWLYRGQ